MAEPEEHLLDDPLVYGIVFHRKNSRRARGGGFAWLPLRPIDAQAEQYVDLIEAGIIDPAKVVRTALQDAASVAALIVTTEALVAELPKDRPAFSAPGAGAEL